MMHGPYHGQNEMHWMHAYGNSYGTIWMILFWVLFSGIVVYLIVIIIKHRNKAINHPQENNTPMQILRKRLAKGEIDEVEYERLKAVIKRDDK